ncbi:MAG: hypothetical protein MJ198_04220 [Bacteroidales bacterium]|nr:hypothetical protein [Bacteroidales bacterium]
MFVEFEYYCNGQPLQTNKYFYVNSLGTSYQINDLQFFISNVAVCINGAWTQKSVQFKDFDGITKQYCEPYYFDAEDTLKQNYISFEVKKRKLKIDSIRFTFGIPKNLNIPYSLTDSELARMYWPEALGGGYHYMKLNIKFIDNQELVSLFNCHLGRGVVGDNFVDNDFTVTLPVEHTDFNKPNNDFHVKIRMNIDKWFSATNTIDFNLYTKGIMGNQEAMGRIIENGKNAFSVYQESYKAD